MYIDNFINVREFTNLDNKNFGVYIFVACEDKGRA